jgi:hypothetical protein
VPDTSTRRIRHRQRIPVLADTSNTATTTFKVLYLCIDDDEHSLCRCEFHSSSNCYCFEFSEQNCKLKQKLFEQTLNEDCGGLASRVVVVEEKISHAEIVPNLLLLYDDIKVGMQLISLKLKCLLTTSKFACFLSRRKQRPRGSICVSSI